jgi:hypothetical protein
LRLCIKITSHQKLQSTVATGAQRIADKGARQDKKECGPAIAGPHVLSGNGKAKCKWAEPAMPLIKLMLYGVDRLRA